jgi:hypothetical protein
LNVTQAWSLRLTVTMTVPGCYTVAVTVPVITDLVGLRVSRCRRAP